MKLLALESTLVVVREMVMGMSSSEERLVKETQRHRTERKQYGSGVNPLLQNGALFVGQEAEAGLARVERATREKRGNARSYRTPEKSRTACSRSGRRRGGGGARFAVRDGRPGRPSLRGRRLRRRPIFRLAVNREPIRPRQRWSKQSLLVRCGPGPAKWSR